MKTTIARLQEVVKEKKPSMLGGFEIDSMTAGMILNHRNRLSPDKVEKFDRLPIQKMMEKSYKF